MWIALSWNNGNYWLWGSFSLSTLSQVIYIIPLTSVNYCPVVSQISYNILLWINSCYLFPFFPILKHFCLLISLQARGLFFKRQATSETHQRCSDIFLVAFFFPAQLNCQSMKLQLVSEVPAKKQYIRNEDLWFGEMVLG